MQPLLAWTIGLPLAGALVLWLVGRRLPRRAVSVIGVSTVGASAALAWVIAFGFWWSPPQGHRYEQVLWSWFSVGGLQPAMGLYLDPLSLLMLLVVTTVGLLIHVYSVEFMARDPGLSRYFAQMNLFVAAMLTLVLADNLLMLYRGGEGVGLCSYLLIGFWYQEPANGRAARKAFAVTRVGDTALVLGLLLLFGSLGTLQIQPMLQLAGQQWQVGDGAALAAALLLLGGAMGKSAQVPLHTWLPDAMAGPTPTSALIHAATMVTAGVYLIARMNGVFLLAPVAMLAVAVVGAFTLLLAGACALAQRDIKRILAWSTISQIGYMMLALGVGAWSAAMFHFMTHALFKALLFLAAGVVIEAQHHEHDIFKMGGLRRRLPIAFWSFVLGGSALAGLPLVTSGFYSKDLILWSAWSSPAGSGLLFAAGLAGAVLTALYVFRLIFVVFWGDAALEISRRPGWLVKAPLVALSAGAVLAALANLPAWFGVRPALSEWLAHALPAEQGHGTIATEGAVSGAAALAFGLGIAMAWRLYGTDRSWLKALEGIGPIRVLRELLQAGWGFDVLQRWLLVRPVEWLARADRDDFIESVYEGSAELTLWSERRLGRSENGRVRWYAAAVAAGSVLFVAIALWYA